MDAKTGTTQNNSDSRYEILQRITVEIQRIHKIKNTEIRNLLEITPLIQNIQEKKLKQFEHTYDPKG